MLSNARAAAAPNVKVPTVTVPQSLLDGLIRIGLMALALLCPPLFRKFTAGIEESPAEQDTLH